jgi:hypothetical protein
VPGAPLPPPTPARRGPLRTILIVVGALLLLFCIGGGFAIYKVVTSANDTDPEAAKVGACLSGDSLASQAPDQFKEVNLNVVDCTDSKADYKVVGRVEKKTQAEANVQSICNPFSTAEFVYWQGQPGKQGTVLCLGPNRR